MDVDNNPENADRVNGRYADLKDRTEDTLRRLNDVIDQKDKDLETKKKFLADKEMLVSELGDVRDIIKGLGPAAKDTEKIKEQMEKFEVSQYSCL